MTDQPGVIAPSGAEGLEAGMKNVPVMVYTSGYLSWGDMRINENMRVTLVLQGTTVPDYISLYDAKQINLDNGMKSKPLSFSELHVPTALIIALHITPPQTEPLDYDPDEPNRMMQPVIAQVGKFNFHGHARISTQTNIKKFVEVTRSEFISLYDLGIVHTAPDSPAPIKVPMAMVRRLETIIAN